MSKRDLTSTFELEGQFLGFAAKKGNHKLKYLRLADPTREYTIKISKDLRHALSFLIVPGEWLSVTGQQKQNLKTGVVKRKAVGVNRVASAGQAMPIAVDRVPPPEAVPMISDSASVAAQYRGLPTASPACILFCQKSDCCKRGGQQVAQALQEELADRALAGVILKGTGCMKRCKAGPNIVMPDKTRYTRISPEEVPAILDKHFPQPV